MPSISPKRRIQHQNLSTAAKINQFQPAVYRLRRFTWRASLSIVGPLLLVGFYAFICFYYLNRPVENGIIPFNGADGRACFYAWFILSIFALDWARSALANVQAAALMHPGWAPSSAMKLMWHVDDNWANVLWWLRGIRNFVFGLSSRIFGRLRQEEYHTQAGRLWWFLSITSMFVFVAIPLSGLTMELLVVSSPSGAKALILGPNPGSFNMKAAINLPEIVRGKWKSGGPTTPVDNSIFYAPEGSRNTSTTFYNDAVMANNPGPIQTFLGPAVEQAVAGSAWGIEAHINCQLVAADALKLIRVHGFGNYSWWNNYKGGKSSYGPLGARTLDGYGIAFAEIEETGTFYQKMAYSLATAADGTWQGTSPYDTSTNWDQSTLDFIINDAPPNQPTTGLWETYLWQGTLSRVNDSTFENAVTAAYDSTMAALRKSTASYISTSSFSIPNNAGYEMIYDLVGFGLQCHIKSAVGNATVSPAKRTYSSFKRGTSAAKQGGDYELPGLQALAMESMCSYNATTLTSEFLTPFEPSSPDSTWLAMHLAIRLPAYVNQPQVMGLGPVGFNLEEAYAYPALTPLNVTRAMYKLLGESLIGMMGPGSQNGWYGDLHVLEQQYWLTPGVVSWQLVLALLVVWAILLVGGSVWTLSMKRWAAKLDGFEMFRFGAQYKDEVNAFRAERFEKCEKLDEMPGMVGSLGGEAIGGRQGFIGLSNDTADQRGIFVFERARAGSVMGGGNRKSKTM